MDESTDNATEPGQHRPLHRRERQAWWVIIACIAVVLGLNALGSVQKQDQDAGQQEALARAADSTGLLIWTRLMVASGVEEVYDRRQRSELLREWREVLHGPRDQLRLAVVHAAVVDAAAARDYLQAMQLPAGDPRFAQVQRDLLRLYGEEPGALPPAARDRLRQELGWFGELALVQNAEPGDPARERLLRHARYSSAALSLSIGALLLVLVASPFCFGVALRRMARKQWRWRYWPPNTPQPAFLGVFALYLVVFLLFSVINGALGAGLGVPWIFLIVMLILCWRWLAQRGHDEQAIRAGLGWHRGAGFWREVRSAAFGYAAGLPIVLVGFLITLLLALLLAGEDASQQVSHPIVDRAQGAEGLGDWFALLAIASLWAPLMEETFFRGALYQHLRVRGSVLAAGLGSGLLFAVVHPQGLVGVPVLIALALVLALMREWRGSILAPALAHAFHNGTLILIFYAIYSSV